MSFLKQQLGGQSRVAYVNSSNTLVRLEIECVRVAIFCARTAVLDLQHLCFTCNNKVIQPSVHASVLMHGKLS